MMIGAVNSIVQDPQGFLWIGDVDWRGQFTSDPIKVTDELTDAPSWMDEHHLLYQTPKTLKIINVEDHSTLDVPIDLNQIEKKDRSLLIQNASIINTSDGTISDKRDILIRNGKIEKIGNQLSEIDYDEVIDAQGKYIMPGLIDIHAHQGSFGGAIQGRQWLAWGVTSTRDPATNPYDALNRKEGRQAGKLTGPRLFFTGSPLDGGRVYYDGTYALAGMQQMELELKRAEELEYDFIKTYVRLPDTWQKRAVEKAHELGVPITSHELHPAAAYGVDGVEHILGTSRRGYSPKMTRTYNAYDDVISLIAQSGMTFTPTISIYTGYTHMLHQNPDLLKDERLQQLESPFTLQGMMSVLELSQQATDQAEVKFERSARMIKEIHDRGGNIVAGTDSPIVPYGFGLFIELLCYEEAGLTPSEVLKIATVNNAKCLGVQHQLGKVEEGMMADLIILDENPLEGIRNLASLRYVVIGGAHYLKEELLSNSFINNIRN